MPEIVARILTTPFHVTSYDDLVVKVVELHRQKKSSSVIFANVHVVMEAYDDRTYADVVRAADIVAPDGMPLVWSLRRLGFRKTTRVYGPFAMLRLLAEAETRKLKVGLLGARAEDLHNLRKKISRDYPKLEITYDYAPPYGPVETIVPPSEIERIRTSKVDFLFVSLGCPKQEIWMQRYRSQLPCVTFGVGAAFDFFAGNQKMAPPWLQHIGGEWLYRLYREPRRLWRRYYKHNPRFLWFWVTGKLLPVTDHQNEGNRR